MHKTNRKVLKMTSLYKDDATRRMLNDILTVFTLPNKSLLAALKMSIAIQIYTAVASKGLLTIHFSQLFIKIV